MKKYEILENKTKVVDGRTLYRIRALKDFGNVKIGSIGGWVETEENLSQSGNCFIYDNAHVYGNARVIGNARIFGNAHVSGTAYVYDNARVSKDACVSGCAHIFGNAHISEEAYVYGNTRVYGNAYVCGNAHVYENTNVYENACIRGFAQIYGYAHISGDAYVYGNAHISEDACVYGNAHVHGDAIICESMWVSQADVMTDLSKNLKESIRCQTELGVFNNKVIAYKQVNKDLTSFYDKTFKYAIGETIETAIKVKDKNSSVACGSGLHFSNMNYWNHHCLTKESVFLIAEINLDDIIAVQEGKIRCKRAKILGVYEI